MWFTCKTNLKNYLLPTWLNVILFVSCIHISITAEVSYCQKSPNSNNCRCESASGYVDLNPLVNLIPTEKGNKTADYAYYYTPCKSLSRPTNATTTDPCYQVAACQESVTGTPVGYFDLGDQDTAVFVGEPGTDNFAIQYYGVTKSDRRNLTVFLKCTHDDTYLLQYNGEKTPKSKEYTIVLTSKHSCLHKTNSKQGLSVGSILVITFFVLLFVYFVGGMLLLRFGRGARGIEQVPNYEFWACLPGLIKEGIQFVLRGCKADTDQTYEKI